MKSVTSSEDKPDESRRLPAMPVRALALVPSVFVHDDSFNVPMDTSAQSKVSC